MLTTSAQAKINLYLQITGKRPDGYHYLSSLVAFTEIGDQLTLIPSSELELEITGPMAPQFAAELPQNNLILRAAKALAAICHQKLPVKFKLEKNLPIASGIGGGSADAAAALRLLAQFWQLPAQDPRLTQVAANLGQDIPCCLTSRTCFFKGIGDITIPGPVLPACGVVLVNPLKPLPTPAVYKARKGDFSTLPDYTGTPLTAEALAQDLSLYGNDLTTAAVGLMPEVKDILAAIEASPDCLLARMSGSGATCFGLYSDQTKAQIAAATLQAALPSYWVVASQITNGG